MNKALKKSNLSFLHSVRRTPFLFLDKCASLFIQWALILSGSYGLNKGPSEGYEIRRLKTKNRVRRRLIRSQWIKTHFIKRKDWIIIKSGVQGKKSIFTPLRGSPIGFKGARKNGMDKQGYLCKFKEIRLLAKMKISKLSYCDWGNFIPLFRDWGGFRFFNLSRPNFNRCRLIGRFIPLRTY